MTEQGTKIVERAGIYYVAGVLNEYTDLSPMLKAREPLRMNMQQVTRLNSIGVRNLLRFLTEWGPKQFVYEQCPSEFIDQINMIPALLGSKGTGRVESFSVPYECEKCEHEEDIPGLVDEYVKVLDAGDDLPKRICRKCGGTMHVINDSFFMFLSR